MATDHQRHPCAQTVSAVSNISKFLLVLFFLFLLAKTPLIHCCPYVASCAAFGMGSPYHFNDCAPRYLKSNTCIYRVCSFNTRSATAFIFYAEVFENHIGSEHSNRKATVSTNMQLHCCNLMLSNTMVIILEQQVIYKWVWSTMRMIHYVYDWFIMPPFIYLLIEIPLS